MKTLRVTLSTYKYGRYKKWFCTRLNAEQYAAIVEANSGDITTFAQWKKLTDGDALLPLNGYESEYDDFVMAGFSDDATITVTDQKGKVICKGYRYDEEEDYYEEEDDEEEDVEENEGDEEGKTKKPLPLVERDYQGPDSLEEQILQAREKHQILFLQDLSTSQAFDEKEAFVRTYLLELDDNEAFNPEKLRIQAVGDISDSYLFCSISYDGKELVSTEEPDSFDYESFGVLDYRIDAPDRPNPNCDKYWGFDWINDGNND